MGASVLELAAAVREGEVSARQLVERSLAAIDERNGALNAFVHVDADGALRAADDVDDAIRRGRPVGPLAGVPFGVKDLEDCAGMPTAKGSRWYAGGGPVPSDDIHVGRLRAAGAIPVGKTATPEFGTFGYTASPAFGVTRNPWALDRTPGGSSGGSAAAVSADIVPFATASDGGGSIRGPAGMTGLVGLRTTYGRIPTLGGTHLAQNAVVGCLTTTVADHAALIDAMAGPDARDRTCLPAPSGAYLEAIEQVAVAGLRATWSADLGFAVVDEECAAIAERAARRLVEAARLLGTDVSIQLDDYLTVYTRIEGVDKFVGVAPELWTERLDDLDPLVRPGWPSTARATLPKLARIEEQRRLLVQQAADLFARTDVVMTPTSTVAAFAAEGPMPTSIAGRDVHGGMASVLQMFASLVNLPAISVPAGCTVDGRPVGLQIIAPRFREDVCLRLARVWEQVAPWPRHADTRTDVGERSSAQP